MTPDKPTAEQKMDAVDLARKMGYPPDSVHDVAEVIAPWLTKHDAEVAAYAANAANAELRGQVERCREEVLAHEHRVDMLKAIGKRIILGMELERGLKRFADMFEKAEYASVGLTPPQSPASPEEGK